MNVTKQKEPPGSQSTNQWFPLWRRLVGRARQVQAGLRGTDYQVQNEQDARLQCIAQGMQSEFYSNFTWNIIYKNIESQCRTETNIILYINYTFNKQKEYM